MSTSSAVWGRGRGNNQGKRKLSSIFPTITNLFKSSIGREDDNVLGSFGYLHLGGEGKPQQQHQGQQRKELTFIDSIRNLFDAKSTGGACYFHDLVDAILERPQVKKTTPKLLLIT